MADWIVHYELNRRMLGHLAVTSVVATLQPTKTTEADLELVKEHILSFPQYQSHYSRADNPNRKYPSPDLTISKMYSLYKEWCAEKEKIAVSEWMYRQVFNTSFNLSFGR